MTYKKPICAHIDQDIFEHLQQLVLDTHKTKTFIVNEAIRRMTPQDIEESNSQSTGTRKKKRVSFTSNWRDRLLVS